jgi:hypothetical protein
MNEKELKPSLPRTTARPGSSSVVAGLLLFLLFAISPLPAWAYVDPGIAAILYQALYALAFGAVSLFVIRPWRYLKSMFGGLGRKRKTPRATPSDTDARDD